MVVLMIFLTRPKINRQWACENALILCITVKFSEFWFVSLLSSWYDLYFFFLFFSLSFIASNDANDFKHLACKWKNINNARIMRVWRYNYTRYLMAKTYPSDDQSQAAYPRKWAIERFTFGWQRANEVKCGTIKEETKQFDSTFFLFVFVRSEFCSPETKKKEITTIKCTYVRKMRKKWRNKRRSEMKKRNNFERNRFDRKFMP